MQKRCLLCLLLVLAACGRATSTPTDVPSTATAVPVTRPSHTSELISSARWESAACPFALPDGYVQGENVDCGYLVVPENRAQLPSRAIRLAVAIFHPAGGATKPDPIFFLHGGPGASVLELIQYTFDEAFVPLLETAQRDLIVFDQRGVGRSKPALDCPNVDTLTQDLLDNDLDGQPISEMEMSDLPAEAFLSCAATLRQTVDLTAYHSAAGATDVNDLRLSLGYDQINLWGGSYGTRLALEVMRLHPEGLRSAVLDAVYPPDVDLYAAAPANFDRALTLLFDSCAANPVCSENYPDLRTVFFDTADRLNASPATTTITNVLTGDAHVAVTTGDALLGFVFQVLYETELKFLLPQIIYDVSRDDFDMMDRIRGALLAQVTVSSRGAMFSVQCHEEIAFSSPTEFDRVLAQYPDLAGLYEHSILGRLSYRVCEGWGAGQADETADEPVASDIPTLLMVGEFDPITPPAWGRHAAETLPNGYLFEYPGVGHGASVGAACPHGMMLAFLNDPTRAPDGTCITGMGQPIHPSE